MVPTGADTLAAGVTRIGVRARSPTGSRTGYQAVAHSATGSHGRGRLAPAELPRLSISWGERQNPTSTFG